jgi:hypothetical protein
MITPTVLPAATEGYHEGFDLHAFAGRDKRAVSVKSKITFQDYDRMHQRKSKGTFQRFPPPEWAMNDEILRELITTYMERRSYCYMKDTRLSLTDRLQRAQDFDKNRTKNVVRLLDDFLERKQVSPVQIQNADTQIVLGRRGMAAILASAVYLRYRCGWTSTDIANEIGIKPPHCRILFYRLNKIYKELKAGKPYRIKCGHRPPMSEAEVLSLFELRVVFGLSWRVCGEVLGFDPMTCRSRFLKAYPVALPAV